MKRKVDILLMVMFLFGSMIFLCPIFGQIKEVEEDDRVYVMQKGVPISSCLLYLLPIAPASS